MKLKTYYKNIGYLTQEPSVFDGSIMDNLMYGVEKYEKIGQTQGTTPTKNNGRGESCFPPEELVKLNGDYKKMLDLQSGF